MATEINDNDNSTFGGMYVNAPQPFYGYAVSGTYKAYSHFSVDQSKDHLKWYIGGANRMELDEDGNLEIDGTIKIAGGSPGNNKVLVSDANGNGSWERRSTNYSNLWIGSNGMKDLTTNDLKVNQGTLTFSKNHENSVIECLFQSHIKHGDFTNSNANIRLNVFIKDQNGNWQTSNISEEVILSNENITTWVSFTSIFNNLASGSYEIEIRARMTSGSSDNFCIDPGNFSQKMIIKETF